MTAANRDQIDACLRVVSNRCRNLRKAIDRAKSWQTAAKSGQVLNDEQAESVRSLPRKEALLAELTEIHKKQTAIAEQPGEPAPTPALAPAKSKRAAAAAPKNASKPAPEPDPKPAGVAPADRTTPSAAAPEKQGDQTPERPTEPQPTEQADPTDPSDPVELPDQNTQSDGEPKSSSSTPPGDTSASPPRAAAARAAESTTGHAAIPEAVTQMIAALELKHGDRLKQTKTDVVRATLNLFHVVDYLRQEGSREALLAFFNSPAASPNKRRLTNLDIDLLIYFNVMLTSPNGNVPHPNAVDVSTAHCLEFINNSHEEAFQDTSYSTLVDIVNTIATCPILTDRSDPIDVSVIEHQTKHVYSQGEPGHLVEAASTKATIP